MLVVTDASHHHVQIGSCAFHTCNRDNMVSERYRAAPRACLHPCGCGSCVNVSPELCGGGYVVGLAVCAAQRYVPVFTGPSEASLAPAMFREAPTSGTEIGDVDSSIGDTEAGVSRSW